MKKNASRTTNNQSIFKSVRQKLFRINKYFIKVKSWSTILVNIIYSHSLNLDTKYKLERDVC